MLLRQDYKHMLLRPQLLQQPIRSPLSNIIISQNIKIVNEIVALPRWNPHFVRMKSSVYRLRWNLIRPIVSLRLGHARVLTTHCVIIHCARVASLPREAGFHRVAISSTEGGYIPSARTDLTEKSHPLARMAFFLAGAQGLEPWTNGFGDRDSTNWTTPLYLQRIYYSTLFLVLQVVLRIFSVIFTQCNREFQNAPRKAAGHWSKQG